MRCPISKFITHTMSHLVFLFLLAAATFGLEERIGTLGEHEGTQLGKEEILRHYFRPASTFGSLITYAQLAIAFWVVGNLWLECKQVYNSGMKEHFRQYYNIMDFLILAFYLSSYTLRFVIYFKLQYAEEQLQYVKQAEIAFDKHQKKQFYIIVNQSRTARGTSEANYFMEPSRFHWDCYDPEIVSNVLFALGNVLSFARTTYLMPSHELLGPLQISLGRMMTDIVRFMVLFLLVLLAFMVGMTNLYTYYRNDNTLSATETPTENSRRVIESFQGLRETVNTLFFSMFGLITLDNLQINMPNNTNKADPYNPDSTLLVQRIGLILFAIFQVLVTIVLVNMLIAMMSHSFEAVQGDTDVEWKFARTKLWLNFIDEESTLPVPFNIIPTWKTFKYCLLSCKDMFRSGDDDISLHQYDFSKRRENVVLEGLERSGLVFEKSTYTDIIQRIMRRYLFKMDREKVEKEKKEGIVFGEISGIKDKEQSDEKDEKESPTDNMSLTPDCNTIIEEDNAQLLPPLPPVRDIPGSRSARFRRKSDHDDAFRRAARRSTVGRRGKESVNFASQYGGGSSLQLDAIQRGQRLLDARMQDILASRAEHEALQKNMNLMRQIIVQNHQDLACLLDVMRGMSSDIITLSQAFNQFIGFKIKKEKRKAARGLQSVSPVAPHDMQVSRQTIEREKIEAAAAVTSDATAAAGSRSHSSPDVMSSPDRRSSRLSSIKKKLSFRKSHQPGRSSNA